MRLGLAVCAAAFLIPESLFACETDPFLFQLPGETVKQAEDRSEAVGKSFNIVETYNRQDKGYRDATNVYLGRVISKRDLDIYLTGSTTVRPLNAIKGRLPKNDQNLSGIPSGGLCSDRGDGLGAFSSPGELVVVYEGLPASEDRPRGIDSFPAQAARTVPLLDKLRELGKNLED